MKNKYSILIVVFIISFWACKEKRPDAVYSIEGNLQELTSPDIYLVSFISPDTQLDTIAAKNGKFRYENSSDSLQAILLYMQEKSVWITIWAKNGDRIRVSGDINYPELLEVEGGEINDRLTNFKQDNKESIKRKQDLVETLQSNQNENLSIPSDNEAYAEVIQLRQSLKDEALVFIEENPSSVASLILLQDYVINNESPAKIRTYMNMLTGEARENALYPVLDRIVSRLAETSSGSNAPSFSLVDIDKDTISLNTFADNYFLLNFSLPQNDSCKRFTDELIALLKDKANLSLKALTVSLDKDSILEESYSGLKPGRWYCAIDNDGWNAKIVSAYNITMITDNVLVGKDGRLLAHNISPDSINTIITNNNH